MKCHICGSDAVFTCEVCSRSGCNYHYHKPKYPIYSEAQNKYIKVVDRHPPDVLCTVCYKNRYIEHAKASQIYCDICGKLMCSPKKGHVNIKPIHIGEYVTFMKSYAAQAPSVRQTEWRHKYTVCSQSCKEKTDCKTKEETKYPKDYTLLSAIGYVLFMAFWYLLLFGAVVWGIRWFLSGVWLL